MYPGLVSNGELISVPGVAPSAGTFDAMLGYARANGPGFHMLTLAEYAALALLVLKSNGGNDPVRGANQWGRSSEAPWETGVRADGQAPGTASGDSRILTGSGPLTWRHDGTALGVADLVGSTKKWLAGARLVNGEIQIVPNNDAALATTDLSSTSTAWRAIRASDGALVTPGTSGTLKYDIPLSASYSNDGTAQNLGTPILRTTTQTPPAGWGTDTNQDYAAGLFKDITADTGITPPAILKVFLLFPHAPLAPTKGGFLARSYGERMLLRQYGRGVASLAFEYGRSTASLGAYPAYVL